MRTYIVKRLDQAKLLTDPFKLKLLEGFAKPATTKQLADRMGEKAPRLYRHVDAMVEAGLLELVEEKPKRGTIERYYRTVAERFEVDPDLFAGDSDEGGPSDMIRSVFRETESDLLRVLGEFEDAEPKPIMMKMGIRGTAEELAELRTRLENWLESCGQVSDGDDAELESWSALIAFYPRPDDGDPAA